MVNTWKQGQTQCMTKSHSTPFHPKIKINYLIYGPRTGHLWDNLGWFKPSWDSNGKMVKSYKNTCWSFNFYRPPSSLIIEFHTVSFPGLNVLPKWHTFRRTRKKGKFIPDWEVLVPYFKGWKIRVLVKNQHIFWSLGWMASNIPFAVLKNVKWNYTNTE